MSGDTVVVYVIGICVAGALFAYATHMHNKQQETQSAVSAGLVQQIVKIKNHTPIIIWVKPPAEPLVVEPSE